MLRCLLGLCLLSLSQVSLVAQSGATKNFVPETCPVTKPSDHLFVPPSPERASLPSPKVFWYGTGRFWTFLPPEGIWPMGQKTWWFREEWVRYDGANRWIPKKEAAQLRVTARRLDGPAPPTQIPRADSAYRNDWKGFLVNEINFPTTGCWEISGKYEDDELTYVEWIVK
jgi:hypothetical protein